MLSSQVGQCTLDRCAATGFSCDNPECLKFMASEIKRRAWEFDAALAVKERREAKGWSVDYLADMADVEIMDVEMVEGLRRGYKAEALQKIVEALGFIYVPFFED